MDWPEVATYRCVISAQQPKQEIITKLFQVTQDSNGCVKTDSMIKELLLNFYQKNRRKPERIIFYRDGVSESQFSPVLLHEVDAIRKACISLDEHYVPPITFLVVQKRHQTRLFPLPTTRKPEPKGIRKPEPKGILPGCCLIACNLIKVLVLSGSVIFSVGTKECKLCKGIDLRIKNIDIDVKIKSANVTGDLCHAGSVQQFFQPN
ncbi:protein argonaute MEL1-like [Triticum aestivum]|uniref:protein argonaute MEL1-like n=1 Tax=Triticum aestivum TaxID=4565 RepID=UPI001D006BD3|nr:protein argonaute MEL1-like [Triticum aestivum]